MLLGASREIWKVFAVNPEWYYHEACNLVQVKVQFVTWMSVRFLLNAAVELSLVSLKVWVFAVTQKKKLFFDGISRNLRNSADRQKKNVFQFSTDNFFSRKFASKLLNYRVQNKVSEDFFLTLNNSFNYLCFLFISLIKICTLLESFCILCFVVNRTNLTNA